MNNAGMTKLRDRLYCERSQAEAEHARIQREMLRIMLDVPAGGIPLADDNFRRIKAPAEARAAFKEYERAFKRFHESVERGIIPDEQKDS